MDEQRREREQMKNALENLAEAKKRREEDRERRVRAYGILDRKTEKAEAKIKRVRLLCNCGAVDKGTIHAEKCAVVIAARSMRRG